MADYNSWMNEKLYAAASQLAAPVLAEHRGAYFGSILGTLNHILVADTIWLGRFALHPAGFSSLDHIRKNAVPSTVDAVLHSDLEGLRDAREEMDKTIRQFALELSIADLASSLTYSNTTGNRFTRNFGHLIQHFFNHQTHHRGQVSTLLNQAGIDIGVTDLLSRIPDEHT
ncbi:MAG: DinB family protein [Gammaproteobacteria bacterium]